MPAGLDQLSPKVDPILDILDQLGSKYWSDHETSIGETVHIFLLGVSDEAAGQGAATGLLQFCLSNATQNGYSKAVTEATNRVSQHIFRKLGFVEQSRGSYEAYRLNGQAVFSSIAAEGGPMIMDYRLRDE